MRLAHRSRRSIPPVLRLRRRHGFAAAQAPFGEGGHPPTAALVRNSAVLHAQKGQVSGLGASIRLAASRNHRGHHRHQVDAALVAHHVHVAARIHEARSGRDHVRRAGRVVPSSLGDLSAALVELGGQAGALADLGAELTRARMVARMSVAPHRDPIQGLAGCGLERLDPPA